MERVIVTNYQEVKDELIDYIIAVRRNRYNQHNYLTLAVDPDKGKMDINIRFDNSYYYPFEVEISSFHEIYAGCCEDIEEKAIDLLDAAITTIAVEYGIEIELREVI